jgi:hypothetical protein
MGERVFLASGALKKPQSRVLLPLLNLEVDQPFQFDKPVLG